MYHPTTFFNGSPSAFLATPRENPLCVFASLREVSLSLWADAHSYFMTPLRG